MSQVAEANCPILSNPPWKGGKAKYRLGLKPINLDEWFDTTISSEIYKHKKSLIDFKYDEVIATTTDSSESQIYLSEKISGHNEDYPDLIANISLQVPDDLCIIQSTGEQKLLAASVCSPSYWNLKEKIGKSLREVHKPVISLNEKIGNPIEKFIANAPINKPFKRENWFIHGDSNRYHLEPEGMPKTPIEKWVIRSERETLCRYHEKYTLFAINVRFSKFLNLLDYPEAANEMLCSLSTFDDEEIKYFGGENKVSKIKSFLQSHLRN